MSVMLCTGATFVTRNSCVAARVVSFDTAGLYLLLSRILEPYSSKDIELVISVTLSHVNGIIIAPSN